jgi:hypothetical protein
MSKPHGHKKQNSCQSCKFVYRSDLHCYCTYGYPVPRNASNLSVEAKEQLDEFGWLDIDDEFYKWQSDKLVSDSDICDSYKEGKNE